MNMNVTGDPMKDSYRIMVATKHIGAICEALKKRLSESEDISSVLHIELALLDIKDCAKSIYDQTGEHS